MGKEAQPIGHSRGSRLLAGWRGERQAQKVAETLGLNPVSYSRFENGVRRPPADVMFRIEEVTKAVVPAKAWLDMERTARKKAS